ncbi:delta-12 fatty acid desaturase [Cristinia sonorae]|uniref:Delta-12 fatty acid desaturase n=1 Tax=Cristinia sonorae TaxID=1940300 RepID=A0A8K0UUH1_9AGAR|nr:delta-12 fatty acid desaturase [Cristinia sonorae]
MASVQSYEQRLAQPFEPTRVKFSEVQAAIPSKLRHKSFARALLYVFRDATFSWIFFELGSRIDSNTYLGRIQGLRWVAWGAYWFWQSVAWGGFWTLAHEACHGNFSTHYLGNYIMGYILHSVLLVPHFAWRSTHLQHHKYTNSLERDENFVPYTRDRMKLPQEEVAQPIDYEEILGEAPLFILLRLVAMQILGWPSYLFFNTMGAESYPPGTNHFSPYSPLFKPKERLLIVLSDVGIFAMSIVLFRWTQVVGFTNFMKLYLIPWLITNHWIVMLTYLQHSDPTIPHYRAGEWNWLRGGLATVDRPLLGWIGRFFLHNISHDHVAHHLFPSIPFYNQPQVTEAIKPVLKTDYCYDSTNTFKALYRSFKQCVFVEDVGGILFYKDRTGKLCRQTHHDAAATAPAQQNGNGLGKVTKME